MLDEHFLRRRGAALHAVEHHDVGAGLHRERGVVIGTRSADLDVDRLLPIGDLADLLDLDLKIVRAGPVRMAAGRALVDPFRQRAHLGHALGDFLAEQHAAAARLGALADDDLDGIGFAQMIGVHAVARRQHLIDEGLRALPLLLGHAAIAGGGGRAHDRGAAAERLLGRARQRAEAHAGDGDRDPEMDRLLGKTRAEHHVGRAFLAIAFQRIAADRCPEKQEIVEMRNLALGAKATNVVDAGRRRAVNLRDRMLVEGRRIAWRRVHPAGFGAHQ